MKCLIDHIVLNVRDMEAMLSFYTGILALPSLRLEEYQAAQVPFPSVRLGGDTIIDFFPEKMWAEQEAGPCGFHLNHFCLAMEKPVWDALKERLQQGNIPGVLTGPESLSIFAIRRITLSRPVTITVRKVKITVCLFLSEVCRRAAKHE